MIYINDLFDFDTSKAETFISQLLDNKTISIKHPLLDIPTFPRVSKVKGMANVILFSDELLNNHWYYIQITKLIDGYYLPSGVLFNPRNMPDVSTVKKAIDAGSLKFDLTSSSTKVDGLIFSQKRPYHYFYDQFVNYFKLSAVKNIDEYCFTDNTCFYSDTESTTFKLIAKKGCYFFPCTMPGNYLDKDAVKMHYFLKNNTSKMKVKSEFTIWLGVTGQKRSWIEQVDGYVEIIKNLHTIYKSITVIVDGWTNYENDDSINVEDNDVYDQIKNEFSSVTSIDFVNLINNDYKSKIAYANVCDFFIANSGTGCMVPFMISNIKGVIHGNGLLNTFIHSYDESVKVVPKEKIISEKSKAIMNNSYSIAWQTIYNLLMGLIGSTARLDEPILKLNSKIVFSELTFSNKTQPAEALRDMALSFEKMGDRKTAYTLMCKALEQRPNGVFIKKKVNEWKCL
ncbi:hypothetical protein [Psychromonas sp. SP041]|uniref:hypothetical protein n=1 Tax=Psychromonas sp. SP041 TaxID=1365007 RepID=UPI00040633DA|nr:hypothetical protein [Psychromonas sp. SP041]